MQCFRSEQAQNEIFNYIINVMLPYCRLNDLAEINRAKFLTRPIVTVSRGVAFRTARCNVQIDNQIFPLSLDRLSQNCPKNQSTAEFLSSFNKRFIFEGLNHSYCKVALTNEQAAKIITILDMYLL